MYRFGCSTTSSRRDGLIIVELLFQLIFVYFLTALRSNELLMMKISRTNILKLNEEERDFLEDLIVETSQALEMANTYTNILNSTLDAFASIISNNQNEVLKRLTTLTIFLSVPILIASIYGMNVPIPYQDRAYAFWVPVILSIVILGLAMWNYWKRLKR